jgi:hypothetical protein
MSLKNGSHVMASRLVYDLLRDGLRGRASVYQARTDLDESRPVTPEAWSDLSIPVSAFSPPSTLVPPDEAR